VTVQLYTDFVPISSISAQQREELARSNQERLIALAPEPANPIYVVLSPEGDVLGAKGGLIEPKVFVEFLSKALEKVAGDTRSTQRDFSGPPGNVAAATRATSTSN
jgi:hypothetical protein